MQQLFENWRNAIAEGQNPKVTCRCLCVDCVFNKDKFCVAEKIDLDYATTDGGKVICECKTYEVGEPQGEG
jgi:hypothetical protein